MKNLITILVLVVLAVGVYLLLTGRPVTAPVEESFTDVDYFLDDSVLGEVDSALADVLSAITLDNQALAAEAGGLENLGGFESPSEIDQYLNEALR